MRFLDYMSPSRAGTYNIVVDPRFYRSDCGPVPVIHPNGRAAR
ncbi:MAG TPA: hypothetical protein VFF44_00210 [Casimicrobiaceae bacterium]|nr:hypothetical protein [Casimicrobiaceae bacterium]